MDPLSVAAAFGLFVVSGVVGFVVERRRARRRAPASEPPAVCGCGHSLALHNPQTNKCHAQDQVPVQWSVSRPYKPIVWRPERCACQRYVGPIPLQAWMNELPGPG